MNEIVYILPRDALEIIFDCGLGEFYFETNFKKHKFRNKGVAVRYDLDEVKDWIFKNYPNTLHYKSPTYTQLLADYETLNVGGKMPQIYL